MFARAILYAAAILAVAALVVGCGSGNAEPGSAADAAPATTAPPLSKAQLIEQGDAICEQGRKKAEAEIERLLNGNAKPSNAEREEFATTISLPAIQAQTEKLGALGVPTGDEKQVEAIVKGTEEVVAEAMKEPRLLAANVSPFVQVDKLATKYGFKVCSQL